MQKAWGGQKYTDIEVEIKRWKRLVLQTLIPVDQAGDQTR